MKEKNAEEIIKDLLKLEESTPMEEYVVDSQTNQVYKQTVWRKPNGMIHRIYGPAIEGKKHTAWLVNGMYHREDGPARIYDIGSMKYGTHYKTFLITKDGVQEWWFEGKLHRTDGPAVEYPNGNKRYFIDGEPYSEKDYWKKIKKREK